MNTNPVSETTAGNRRHFLKQASAATAVAAVTTVLKTPVYGQTQAPSAGRVLSNPG